MARRGAECDTRGVESGATAVASGADGRYLAIDARGVGLRATWRPDRGFVNVSLWRGDRCVETFQLTPAEISGLVAFLVSRLATAAGPARRAGLAVVEDEPRAAGARRAATVRIGADSVRSALAGVLARAAASVAP